MVMVIMQSLSLNVNHYCGDLSYYDCRDVVPLLKCLRSCVCYWSCGCDYHHCCGVYYYYVVTFTLPYTCVLCFSQIRIAYCTSNICNECQEAEVY